MFKKEKKVHSLSEEVHYLRITWASACSKQSRSVWGLLMVEASSGDNRWTGPSLKALEKIWVLSSAITNSKYQLLHWGQGATWGREEFGQSDKVKTHFVYKNHNRIHLVVVDFQELW